MGVWENMRYNGAQVIAFGSWAFNGDGGVVVTHSVYEDFDHWTATRGWVGGSSRLKWHGSKKLAPFEQYSPNARVSFRSPVRR